jgi:glycosyltransferase involved in cell wall biosynthesis
VAAWSQADYDELYYEEYGPRDGSGALVGPPYRRGVAHWHDFFGTIAHRIVEQLAPASALDAGCAIGFLVEELRARGVDAWGVDVSEWAISQVPPDLKPFCRVGSLSEELDRDYDLITCTEVLEHVAPHEAEGAVANLCRHTDTVLFSSSPDDYTEPTHLNVQPSAYWIGLFARHGFYRDTRYDVSYLAPHAVLFRRRSWSAVDVAQEYEQAWWQARRTADGLRTARDLLADQLAHAEERAYVAASERDQLDADLTSATSSVRGLETDRDRLRSLLAVEQAMVESLAAGGDASRDAPARLGSTQALLARRTEELRALRATRLFRYARPFRRAYGRALRSLRGAGSPQAGSGGHAQAPDEPPDASPPAPGTYTDWIARFDTLDDAGRDGIRTALDALTEPPLISVAMPVFDPAEQHLRAAVRSVQDQLYPHWELCIADDASTVEWVPGVLAELQASDPRIKLVRRSENGHISAATNSALALAAGSFVGFLDHDDLLAEDALARVALAAARQPDVQLLYSDEDKIDDHGTRSDPYFKPDWDALLVLGQNYLTHFCVVRRELLKSLGGIREGLEGAQDWDLALRVSETLQPGQIVHIPRVLYHWRLHPQSTSASQAAKPYAAVAARRATTEHLARTGRAGVVEPLGRIGYQRVRWGLPSPPPKVSIIIPTRDGPRLRRCLESLWYRTTYPDYEVLLVDNGSSDPSLLRYLAEHADKLRVLRDSRAFNYPALNNEAARQARGAVLCLLNDDVEVLTSDWLEEMVGQLLQPGVGVVGAKLYYGDGRIQHAGVVLGVGGVAAHGFRFFDNLYFGHFGHTVLARSPSAVTAACMVTRRELWDKLGGLDEEQLPVSYNDVDYCLRARHEGWRVAWTPFAELLHHESTSRGPDTNPDNVARARREHQVMLDRWGEVLGNDPAYNPNLTLDTEDYAPSWPPRFHALSE